MSEQSGISKPNIVDITAAKKARKAGDAPRIDVDSKDCETLGALFRSVRAARRISRETVSEKTKIKISQITAIENMDLDALPGAAYTLGFIRAYAEFLELPADKVIRRFRYEADIHQPAIAPRINTEGPDLGADMGGHFSMLAVIALIGFFLWVSFQVTRPAGDVTLANPQTGIPLQEAGSRTGSAALPDLAPRQPARAQADAIPQPGGRPATPAEGLTAWPETTGPETAIGPGPSSGAGSANNRTGNDTDTDDFPDAVIQNAGGQNTGDQNAGGTTSEAALAPASRRQPGATASPVEAAPVTVGPVTVGPVTGGPVAVVPVTGPVTGSVRGPAPTPSSRAETGVSERSSVQSPADELNLQQIETETPEAPAPRAP